MGLKLKGGLMDPIVTPFILLTLGIAALASCGGEAIPPEQQKDIYEANCRDAVDIFVTRQSCPVDMGNPMRPKLSYPSDERLQALIKNLQCRVACETPNCVRFYTISDLDSERPSIHAENNSCAP
jgi:hypothetical protein